MQLAPSLMASSSQPSRGCGALTRRSPRYPGMKPRSRAVQSTSALRHCPLGGHSQIVEDGVADRNSIRFDFSAHEGPSRSCQDGFHTRKSSSQTRPISRKTRQVLTFALTFPRTFNPLNDAAAINPLRQRFYVCRIGVTVLIALSNRGKACSSKKRSAAPAET
jgi:hypothetical protein